LQPQNPFDLIVATASGDLQTLIVPDSPLRTLSVPSSPGIIHMASSTSSAPTTPQLELGNMQSNSATRPAVIQPRMLPFELQQQPQQLVLPPPDHTRSMPSLIHSSIAPQHDQQQQPQFPVASLSHDDDDGNTEPSSQPSSHEHSDRTNNTSATTPFARLLNSKRRKQSEEDGHLNEEDRNEGALIYGYLQKLGRNGKWQSRWFETDGECLSYYKSSKRTKLLATLDLQKVRSSVRL
jgi:hypothetical protein